MDYVKALEELKAKSLAEKTPYFENTYANFLSMRTKIFAHIQALADHNPAAAPPDQIMISIDEMLALQQIMQSSALTDSDWKAFLIKREFFIMP